MKTLLPGIVPINIAVLVSLALTASAEDIDIGLIMEQTASRSGGYLDVIQYLLHEPA